MGRAGVRAGKVLVVAGAYSFNPRLWLTVVVGGLVVWGIAYTRAERSDAGDLEDVAARADWLAQQIRAFVEAQGGAAETAAEFETRFGAESRDILGHIGERVPDAEVRAAWPVTDEEVLAVADRLAAAAARARGLVAVGR